LVSVTVVAAVLLAVVLAVTTVIGRLARLDRGDAVVLLFCGSKKSLASGLPMALVLFPAATVGLTMLPLMLFHQIQLVVCAVIASRLARDADEIPSARSASMPPAAEVGEGTRGDHERGEAGRSGSPPSS
jgi:sodium/bile acid cotransporter 7